MTSLYVICGLPPPPIKNPGYAYGLYHYDKWMVQDINDKNFNGS